jgi:PAS domain S-box-containing protein
MVETSAASALSAVACSHAVASFAMDGTVLEANPVFLKTMGYTLAEVQGKHHRLFVTSEYAASREYDMFWEQLGRGEFQAAEFKRVGKGGKEVWLLATYSPILDASGKPYKVIKFATDLTEQKRRYTAVEREKSVYLANQCRMRSGHRSTASLACCRCFGTRRWTSDYAGHVRTHLRRYLHAVGREPSRCAQRHSILFQSRRWRRSAGACTVRKH